MMRASLMPVGLMMIHLLSKILAKILGCFLNWMSCRGQTVSMNSVCNGKFEMVPAVPSHVKDIFLCVPS